MMRPILGSAPLAALVLLGACGNVPPPDDPDTGLPDAAFDAALDAAVDSGDADDGDANVPPPPRCDVSKPFGTPVEVEGDALNTAEDEFKAWLTDDEKRIYFSRGTELYHASRVDADGAFSRPEKVVDLVTNRIANATNPSLEDGEKTIYFDSRRGSTAWDIYRATRSDPALPFGNVTLVTTLSGDDYDQQPYLVPGGSMYLSSNRVGGIYTLYQAARNGNAFDAPRALFPGVATDWPFVTSDERTIYYSQANHVYEAKRERITDNFSGAKQLTELDPGAGGSHVSINWISPDGCHAYLTSDRDPQTTDRDLYIARKPALAR